MKKCTARTSVLLIGIFTLTMSIAPRAGAVRKGPPKYVPDDQPCKSLTVTVTPSRPVTVEGEDIRLQVHFSSPEPRGLIWDESMLTMKLTLARDGVRAINQMLPPTPDEPADQPWYTDTTVYLQVNHMFYSKGTEIPQGHAHMSAGAYQGVLSLCDSVVAPFSFTILPDSVKR